MMEEKIVTLLKATISTVINNFEIEYDKDLIESMVPAP